MEPTSIAITAVIALVGICVLIKSKKAQPKNRATIGAMGVPGVRPLGPPPPMPPRAKRRLNNKGWTAPGGHHFNEADQLVDEAGELIVDMVMTAQLCGVTDFITKDREQADQHDAHPAVGPEASRAEVTPSTSFSDLQTEDTTRSASCGGGSDSDSDSGGSCDDSGGDCCSGDD